MENKVLAMVEGKEIKEQDLQLLMEGLGQRALQFSTEQGRQQLINELITQELFLLESKDSDFENEDEFKAEFAKVKENFMKQYAIAQLLRKATVEKEEAKAFYEEHKGMYLVKETVQASHILVDSEEKASDILKEINDGKSFHDAAVEYSTCPSNMKGGDLGSFDKGKMVPEFEAEVFNMDLNEVRGPIKTQFGYHLIKLTDKKEAREQKFEEVENQINGQLVAMKQNKLYLEESERLRGKYSVEIK